MVLEGIFSASMRRAHLAYVPESDSAWSDTLSSLGVTSSTVDEDPCASTLPSLAHLLIQTVPVATSDNEDDALPHQPIGRPFYEQTWNQSGTQQALDISSDTYDNVSVQSWNTFYPQPTVDSNLAYTSGRRHSDSQPSQRPVLHRSNPSDSFLAMDMQKLHVGEGSETQSTSPSPSSTVSSLSPWEYPSPASANPANLLQIPTIYRPVTRRYSDSAGQRSRQIPGMLHHSHSESVLGSNDVVVTNGSPIVLGNSGLSNALREPEYCTSIPSCPPWTYWPVPLHAAPVRALSTVDPSFTAMFSGARGPPSSSSVAWDTQMYPPIQRNPSIFAAEISSPLPDTREQGRRVIHIQGSESGYQFYGASSSYFTQPNRVAPSGTSENYNLVDVSQLHVNMQNLAGYQTLAALSSAQSYDGAFFPTPEDTAEYYTPNNAFGYANLDSPPILYVGGLCVPEDSESTSATPTMPVPLAVSPTPENAVAGPSTLVLRLGCKQTRGTREPDPQAQQKMRKVNPQPRHFCTVCSPEHSFTIKSALVRKFPFLDRCTECLLKRFIRSYANKAQWRASSTMPHMWKPLPRSDICSTTLARSTRS